MNKINALANFLECEVEELEVTKYDENVFEYGNQEYAVLTDEEADTYYYDRQQDLIEDMGMQSFSKDFQNEIIDSEMVETEWFEQAMAESNQFYIDDIRDENASSDEYENRLEEEMADNECADEEAYLEYLNNNYDSGIEWYRSNFGDEDFAQVVIKNNLLDIDKIIETIKEYDGRGACLSSYDGNENEFEGYYIYRTN